MFGFDLSRATWNSVWLVILWRAWLSSIHNVGSAERSTERSTERSAKQAGGNVFFFCLLVLFFCLFGGSFWGEVSRMTAAVGRQNRREKETKLGGSRGGCDWQVWMWDESGEEEEEREKCAGKGRVNGERSVSPWMMRGRLTLPGQIWQVSEVGEPAARSVCLHP